MFQDYKTNCMNKSSDYLLKGLYAISWIIFIGLCIDAGGVLTNTVYAIFFNASIASSFWNHIDLSNLFNTNQSSFITLTTLMSFILYYH